MKRVLSKEEMAYWDSYTIEKKHIPALVLMERAALACVDVILGQKKIPSKVAVICGPGNNGGDGVAIARILKCKGIDAHVYMLGSPEKYSDSLKAQITSARSYRVQVESVIDIKNIRSRLVDYDFIVDAIFGIGLSRQVNGLIAQLIEVINELEAPVLAVDIPSGFDANTGVKLGVGVNADYTVTFGYGKKGLYLSDCFLSSGSTIVADIGIYVDADLKEESETNKKSETDTESLTKTNNLTVTNDKVKIKSELVAYNKNVVNNNSEVDCKVNEHNNPNYNNACYILDKQDIESIIPASKRSDNKGTRGKVLIIAGSENIYGACYLSARAALTTGCGLVRVFTHRNNIVSIQQGIPEAMYYGYGDFNNQDRDQLKQMIDWADAILIGPGLGTTDTSNSIMQTVLEENYIKRKTCVIDADGVNIISRNRFFKEKLTKNVILTPHLKELSRLCDDADVNDIQNNMEYYAKLVHNIYGCGIDLKSFTSFIVTDAGCFINTTGNEGMATAGSGDVLAGIMASLLAQGVDKELAPAVAAYLHGKSGEIASETSGKRGMLASDCINALSEQQSGV